MELFNSFNESRIDLMHTNPVYAAVFSPDNTRLVTYSHVDNTISVWDLSNGTLITALALPAEANPNSRGAALAYSPDGRTLAVGLSGGDALLLDAQSLDVKRTLQVFTDPDGGILSLAFSPDGTLLAVAGGTISQAVPSSDNQIRVFNVDSGFRLALLTGHASHVLDLAFSPDGAFLISSGDNSIRFWGIQ